MKQFLLNVRLLFLILLLFQTKVFCQTYHVSGRVLTDSQYVNHASVVLYNSQTNSIVDSTTTDSLGYYQLNAIVGVDNDEPTLPTNFELAQNYPNPFSNQTEILYKLNKQNEVTIKIYDILGREIKTFRQGEQNIGIHGVRWDGTNNHGIKAVPRIYFYQLITNKEIQTMKMIYSPNGSSFVKNGNRFVTSSNQLRLTKKTNTVWNRYTFEIKSVDSTKPEIVIQRFEDISINSDTTIVFAVEKARIILGQSIEGVEIGDDSLTVINKLGEPDYVGEGDFDGYIFYYTKGSLSDTYVFISKDRALGLGVIGVHVEGTYRGKTKHGITVNSGRDFVINVLGTPSKTQENFPIVYDDYYYSKNIFGFEYYDKQVFLIFMTTPYKTN